MIRRGFRSPNGRRLPPVADSIGVFSRESVSRAPDRLASRKQTRRSPYGTRRRAGDLSMSAKRETVMNSTATKTRREAPLATPTNLTSNATKDLSAALTTLLADVFTLYLKTKNFHWHMSGPHFRDYHLLL